MAYIRDADAQPSTVAQALSGAKEAAMHGDHERAYNLSLEATQIAPDSVDAWLLLAETTTSIEEAVACLNQANSLQPLNPEAAQKTYQVVQKLLEQDPFILYLNETDNLYHVRSGDELSLLVPKDRTTPETYPAERSVWLQNTYRFIWMALLGLPLAGLGSILFAPLAAVSAVGLYFAGPSRANGILSLVVIILSGGLWLCGLLLAVILLMHLI